MDTINNSNSSQFHYDLEKDTDSLFEKAAALNIRFENTVNKMDKALHDIGYYSNKKRVDKKLPNVRLL